MRNDKYTARLAQAQLLFVICHWSFAIEILLGGNANPKVKPLRPDCGFPIADCGLWVNSGLIREIRGKSGVNPFPKQLKETGHEFNPQSAIRNQ